MNRVQISRSFILIDDAPGEECLVPIPNTVRDLARLVAKLADKPWITTASVSEIVNDFAVRCGE